MDLQPYRLQGERLLSSRRWEHCQAVARLARELAEKHGADPEKAELAGLLHDLTKEFPESRQLQMLELSGIIREEHPLPNEYHALTGFLYARDQLGIRDPEVLNAIRYHTAGRAGMSLVEKAVFAADKFAYDRIYSDVGDYRALAFSNLDESLLAFFEFQIPRRIRQRRPLIPDCVSCYNWLLAESV